MRGLAALPQSPGGVGQQNLLGKAHGEPAGPLREVLGRDSPVNQILGFRFDENFDHPYLSTSVGEFWRRWHMSLTSWFREYLYFPLGGSRAGKPRPAPGNRQRPGVLRGLAALPQGPGGVGQQHLLGKARGKAAGSFGAWRRICPCFRG